MINSHSSCQGMVADIISNIMMEVATEEATADVVVVVDIEVDVDSIIHLLIETNNMTIMNLLTVVLAVVEAEVQIGAIVVAVVVLHNKEEAKILVEPTGITIPINNRAKKRITPIGAIQEEEVVGQITTNISEIDLKIVEATDMKTQG